MFLLSVYTGSEAHPAQGTALMTHRWPLTPISISWDYNSMEL